MIISFIGCGFSANSIIYHVNKLATSFNHQQSIINVFESRQTFGDGIAYNLNSEHVLLNRPARYMSIDHNNLYNFYEYLTKKGVPANEYETRKSFGLYLEDTFNCSISSLKHKDILINKHNNKVLDIEPLQRRFEIITSNGNFFSDIIILSTGNNLQKNIWSINSPRYINDVYFEFQTLNQIKETESVLIIGASLSAMDCALFLDSNGHQSQISFMSRSGIIPKVRYSSENIELPVFKQLIMDHDSTTLFGLIKYFRKQLKNLNPEVSWQNLFCNSNRLNPEILHREINKPNDEIQNILLSSNPYIETIWDKLLDKDKINFFSKFYTLYMSNRNPMPSVSAQRILTQLKMSKITVLENKISSISYKDHEFIVKYIDGNYQIFNWIINATGQAKDIEINPLYDKLLKRHLIRKNIIGGIDVDKITQLCLNNNGMPTPGLYAIGPKTLGTYINVNSAEMLSIKAEHIAKQLLKFMEMPPK